MGADGEAVASYLGAAASLASSLRCRGYDWHNTVDPVCAPILVRTVDEVLASATMDEGGSKGRATQA